MYKLIGTDFDGTLLNDKKQVMKKTIESLKETRKRNIIIVGVTGRTLESVKNAVDINIFDYLILNNGSNIYDVVNKKIIYNNAIPKQIAKWVTKFSEEFTYQYDYCTFSTYNKYKNYVKENIPFIKEINSIDEIKDPIAKINIFPKKEANIKSLYNSIKKKYKSIQTIIMQDSGNEKKWIVLTPKNLNKKEALKYLGDLLKIELSEMVFFGDGLNDIEVIETVGMGVAMENALEEIKDKAKYITKSNNEDGIAYFINKELK